MRRDYPEKKKAGETPESTGQRIIPQPGGAVQPEQKPDMSHGDKGLETDTGRTIIDLDNYPDLAAEEGAPVSGRFQGRIGSISGKKATIEMDELDVEGDNQADKALSQLTGHSMGMMQSGDNSDEEE